jgi:hypothetical protein
MFDNAPVGAVGAPSGLAPYQAKQGAAWTAEDQLAALSFAPVFGDVAGLAADAAMYATDPSARTPGNYAMTAAGALPFVPNAKAALLAKALAAKFGGLPALSAITAWHGTPHLFDKFDASKIGTGEGAQAYGHGLYFAESPDVAKEYQRELSGTVAVDGNPVLSRNQKVGTTGDSNIDDLLMMHMGDLGAATKDKLGELRQLRQTFANQPRFTAPAMVGVEDRILKEGQQQLAQLRNLRGRVSSTMDGSLYSVDIPDSMIGRMLDWDKPLSQQAPEVQAAVGRLMPKGAVNPHGLDMGGGKILDNRMGQADPTQVQPWVLSSGGSKFGLSQKHVDRMIAEYGANTTGENAYTRLTAHLGSQGAATEALRKAGLPGIRYLDGGSRYSGTGTSNFVVFPGEESALTILTRNGQPLK